MVFPPQLGLKVAVSVLVCQFQTAMLLLPVWTT
jgi:hypothetical protein